MIFDNAKGQPGKIDDGVTDKILRSFSDKTPFIEEFFQNDDHVGSPWTNSESSNFCEV